MVDIEFGSELTFIKDENISCRVINDREVEFEGTQWSLSQITRDLMNEKFEKHGFQPEDRTFGSLKMKP